MLPKVEALQAVLEDGIVAVVRLDSVDLLIKTAEALANGGIRVIEFTMTTPGAIDMLKEAIKSLGHKAIFGAGTVLDAETARQVILAGGKFLVSPTLDFETIALAHRYSVAIFPGAFTPSEILAAWQAGADMVKVFPASVGGPAYIKAVLAPLPQIKLLPTGGVNLSTAADFLKSGAVALAVGGNLVDKKAIQTGDFESVTDVARKYLEIIYQTRIEMKAI